MASNECEDYERYWKYFESETVKEVEVSDITVGKPHCVDCDMDTLETFDDYLVTCTNCGSSKTYATDNQYLNTSFPVKETIPIKKSTKGMSKIEKKILWSQYTNEEKNEYKLKEYTKELCNTLDIPEGLIPQIKYTVAEVIKIIKNTDGTKRARVKDGIILVCIEYIAKRNGVALSASKLGKKIGVNIKYITRAEGILLELIHSKKLNLDKDTILAIRTPYQYVQDIIRKQNIILDPQVLETIKRVIEICEENDFLLDHTPLSIGVCCFYYVLTEIFGDKTSVDVRPFAEMYDLSIVTVTKTTNKLKTHDAFIRKCLE